MPSKNFSRCSPRKSIHILDISKIWSSNISFHSLQVPAVLGEGTKTSRRDSRAQVERGRAVPLDSWPASSLPAWESQSLEISKWLRGDGARDLRAAQVLVIVIVIVIVKSLENRVKENWQKSDNLILKGFEKRSGSSEEQWGDDAGSQQCSSGQIFELM